MKRIELQTKLGSNIDNFQIDSVSKTEIQIFEEFINRFPLARKLSQIEPHYNCHGFVFASRRTGILPNELMKILTEDCYKEISKDNVNEGDVVIYISSIGDIEHSGLVVERPNKNNHNTPQIISKWGKANEFFHPVNYSPYESSNLKYYRLITDG